MISKEDKAKAAIGVIKNAKQWLGRTGGADLESQPKQTLVSKSRFERVVDGGHKSAFTSQTVALYPKASKYNALDLREPQVTQYKRIGGKRPGLPPGNPAR